MTPSHRLHNSLIHGVLVAALAVVVGVVAGHFLWNAATTIRLTPTANRTPVPARAYGSGGVIGGSSEYGASEYRSGEYGSGEYGSGGSGLFGSGANEGGAGSGEGALGEGASGERASGEGSSGAGSGASASGASGSTGEVPNSITSKVDPALVDINTELGLESAKAAGTGMVVTSDGEVVTNNHVISGATKITATDVGNGATYTARVVGYDRAHDIAVLQLEGASGLQTVSFGGSGSLKTGEGVATIGNAGGTGGTPSATSGHIAALGQSITAGDELGGASERLSGLIQIDGDLRPGDSGGPLVNEQGEVIGMDTAASSTFQIESSADEGFAIPIEQVQEIAKQILDGESSGTAHIGATGMLGVDVQSADSGGALVEDILAGTPAASSGLAAGDTITELDGSSVSTPTALTELILRSHPGDSVTVTWQTSAGAQQTGTVTLANGPPE